MSILKFKIKSQFKSQLKYLNQNSKSKVALKVKFKVNIKSKNQRSV